ncbi:formylglycine-generating enzyme family protein [Flavobacterium sp. C4GT6]|uniref:formylglycine-generating enzyme family protein n=1 Tax=Flavobacterium sp. C4GT6 TaxID=3103818 RepID=UPI002ED63968
MKTKYLIVVLSLLLLSCKNNGKQREDLSEVNATANSSDSLNEAVPAENPKGMMWIKGGRFMLGNSNTDSRQTEGPAVPTEVKGFWIDETEVTNAQFAAFVKATGYKTIAEREINWEDLKKQLPPGTPKPHDSLLVPGSLVFTPPSKPVPLNDYTLWWSWIPGANWRHPEGPDTNIEGKDNYPVVQIAYSDAVAYAEWAGKRLPTEAEWEYAAQAGNKDTNYAWGSELNPGGVYMANFFQGDFPYNNTNADGFNTLAPVKSFPANAYGLYDMIGNVWELTSDWYRPDTYSSYKKGDDSCCRNPTGPKDSYDPNEPYTPKRVIKGGSFLCSEQYCSSYRPDARMANSEDSGQEHVGFRCVKDIE